MYVFCKARAPTHVLVIPRAHYANLTEAAAADPALVGRLMRACTEVAKREGVSEDGYRVVTNIGEDGGQTVKHLHFHLLGGQKFAEKLV